MKEKIKKVLIETLEDKKLQMVYVYFSNYMGTLKKFVDDKGEINFYESGDKYAKIWIRKESSRCWVSLSFCAQISTSFSLEYNETLSIINIWVENNYQLKGIDTQIWANKYLNILTN